MKKIVLIICLVLFLITLTSCVNGEKQNIIFDSNGGEPIETMMYRSGSKLENIPVAKKEGFVFSGWYSDEELKIKVTEDTKMPANDLILYAGWDLSLVFFGNFMDTDIRILIKLFPQEKDSTRDEFVDEIINIYSTFHDLSTNRENLPENSNFIENVYSINAQPNEFLEIDQELYELLKTAEEYKELTNGHFDVSIGKIIDVWKSEIEYKLSGLEEKTITEDEFQNIIDQINDIEVVENPFTLEVIDDKYFITINHQDVKIDLGAIAKGYATQKVSDYILNSGFSQFSISAGQSSIVLGENPNREENYYLLSLENPVSDSFSNRNYGYIYVKNTSVTTSGNYLQYVVYGDKRYHHIISPKTKMPMHYYHTVTIIGEDAGLLDAISTAMLSMSPTELDLWLDEYQHVLDIEVIRFNYDESITTNLTITEFMDKLP
ncbi:MAG: FAD:protein FMN transferase [Acholeplasmataceae bacterium]|jgi:thiamine biosynthesis lipoprotein|nr:FAD:protein FMN transferase [Acholeplasmataceae bacterium]